MSAEFALSKDGEETTGLTTPTIFDKDAIQSLPRHYIISQLKEAGFKEIADQLSPVSNPNDPVHRAFEGIATTLSEEREEQFTDMLSVLSVEESTLKETYDTIVLELFKGQIHWGKMVTFIVFTSHVVLYSARREHMRHKVPEIVEWTETVIHEKLHHWIEEQGGWQALVEHFDTENWRVSLSTILLGIGLSAGIAAGGILALKKMILKL
jgi:hypothetical protein